MKQGWEIKKLGDLCQIELGKTPYRGDKSFWDTEKKTENVWLSIADLLNTDGDVVSDSKEYITEKAAKISKPVKKGTFLLSFKLTLGRLAFTGKDLFTNEAIAALTINNEKELDKYFLYQFLSLFDWNAAAEGDVKVKGKTLNKAKLKEIEVHYPKSLPEQQRIVSILDEAFAAIAKAKANAEQNLRNAKEVFESYLQGVFEGKGDGWEEKTLGEVCLFKGGGTPSTKVKEYWEGEIPWVSPKDMKSKIISNSQDHLTIEAIKNSSASLIPKGSILIVVRSGILARIVPIGITEEVVSINQDLKALCPKKNIDSNFLCYFMEGNMRFLLSKVTRGATVHRISTDSLRDLRIGVPNIKDQQTIVKKLDTLSTETKKLEAIYQQKINDLEEMKKSILQKAFSGGLNYDSFD